MFATMPPSTSSVTLGVTANVCVGGWDGVGLVGRGSSVALSHFCMLPYSSKRKAGTGASSQLSNVSRARLLSWLIMSICPCINPNNIPMWDKESYHQTSYLTLHFLE